MRLGEGKFYPAGTRSVLFSPDWANALLGGWVQSSARRTEKTSCDLDRQLTSADIDAKVASGKLNAFMRGREKIQMSVQMPWTFLIASTYLD